MPRRAVRTVIGIASVLVAASGVGCSSLYKGPARSNLGDGRVRPGAGDSLGSALFQHQVQTANAIRFNTSPAFASEMSSR